MSNQDTVSEEMFNKPMTNLMWQLSIPSILGMLVISLNTFFDAVFVGHFIGKSALGGIALALPITLIVAGLSSLAGVGSASVLSRAIGSKHLDKQSKIFGNMLTMCIIISIPLTAVGYWFASELISFLGGRGEILKYGKEYLEIFMLGSFLRIYSVSASMIIRAEGKIRAAMIITGVSMLLNILFAPVFIYTLNGGVVGAAWASVLSLLIYAVWNTWYLLRYSSIPYKFNQVQLNYTLLREVLPIGFSGMMMQVLFFVQQTIVFKSVAYYGTDDDITFMGAFYRIIMLAIVPVFGFVQSLQPVVGICFGAKKYMRVIEAVRVFSINSTLFLALICLPMQIFPETVLGWLLPNVVFSSQDLFNFRIAILFLPTTPIMFIGVTLFQSIGNSRLATILLLTRQLFLYVPVVLLLPLYWGLSGIYLAAAMVDGLVLFYTLYLLGRNFRSMRLLAQSVKV